MMLQNHQDIALLLEVMRRMSTDLVTLIATFNQFIGFKIRKEKKKAGREYPAIYYVKYIFGWYIFLAGIFTEWNEY